MQEAMDLAESDTELLKDNNNIYTASSIIIAKPGKKIKGEDIEKLYEKSKKTGVRFSHLLKEENHEDYITRTIISPAEDIPDIAARTEHKKKS